MRKRDQANLDAASLDELVEEITVDASYLKPPIPDALWAELEVITKTF